MQQFVTFVCLNLIRQHFALLWFPYGFARGSTGYGIATLFTKCAAIQRTRHIFTAKSEDCGTLQDGGRTVTRQLKCGAHGGRKATHITPHFQMPLWRVCCILYSNDKLSLLSVLCFQGLRRFTRRRAHCDVASKVRRTR